MKPIMITMAIVLAFLVMVFAISLSERHQELEIRTPLITTNPYPETAKGIHYENRLAEWSLEAEEATKISEEEIQISGGFKYTTKKQVITGESAIINTKTGVFRSCRRVVVTPVD